MASGQKNDGGHETVQSDREQLSMNLGSSPMPGASPEALDSFLPPGNLRGELMLKRE
jgi:hypothetical protein